MRSYKSMKEALAYGRGAERPFNCPEHDDAHASATVNVEKGVWFCHACHASGKTQDGKHDVSYIRLLQPEEPIPAMSPLSVEYTNAYLGYGQYWATRYGPAVAAKFATGVDPVTGYPCLPIMDAIGTTVHGFLLRRPDGEEGPKYLYPRAVPVSRLLFGHHLVRAGMSLLVLVEGASDVMSLHRWPVPKGAGVVGVYGAGLHAVQTELVAAMSPLRVVCAMDADSAGALANERSAARLAEAGVGACVYNWRTAGVTDPGELEEDPWPSLMRAR